MASTIKVDNIQDQCGSAVVTKCGASKTLTVTTTKADNYQAADGGNIINQCGTTITLGASGDTIQLASGASQTGFGRTGTVDWDTTAKTANFTAVSGTGYFVNTTSGAITATLPASPSAGDIVGFNDYARTFATNNLTIARNGSNIQGAATDITVSTDGQSLMLVYVDGTQGWIPTEDQTINPYGAVFITATGGTTSTCGDYKYHKFTGPGTFTVCSVGNPIGSDTVQVLVVAGGGGASANGSGGGGAGGLRNVSCTSVTAQGYPITVGAGGSTGASPCVPATTDGSPSTAISITSTGGGRGGIATGASPQPYHAGNPGGSGGGGSGNGRPSPGGSGNTPPVSPSQGNDGGSSVPNSGVAGAGGGGASQAGSSGTNPGPNQGNGGDGGAGTDVSPSFPAPLGGSPAGFYAGGGGGAANNDGGTSFSGGTGGAGGGGNGGGTTGPAATAGTANTGGGGGASPTTGPNASPVGGAGGSGIVIIRYKYQ